MMVVMRCDLPRTRHDMDVTVMRPGRRSLDRDVDDGDVVVGFVRLGVGLDEADVLTDLHTAATAAEHGVFVVQPRLCGVRHTTVRDRAEQRPNSGQNSGLTQVMTQVRTVAEHTSRQWPNICHGSGRTQIRTAA